eukprot:g8452.t1
MSSAAVASAANGIARRSRVRSLGSLRKTSSFRAVTPPVTPPGGEAATPGSLKPTPLVRCRSASAAPPPASSSSSTSSGSVRSCASSACIISTTARRGAVADEMGGAGDADGGRFMAGAAALAGALLAAGGGNRDEHQRMNRGNDKTGGAGTGTTSWGWDAKAPGGGGRVWCDGGGSASRLPPSLASFRRRHQHHHHAAVAGGNRACFGCSGGGGGSEGDSDAEQVEAGAELRAFDGRPALPAPRGRITDVYRFEGNGEPVGRGQRATVSTATHLRTGQTVAVKRLLRAQTTRLEVMEEVSLLKVAGKHPNVVSLQAFFEDQEAFYIVMEMCEGGELYHRLADKGRYSEGQAARIMAEVASAVGFLHRNAIIHFDLKPENIMLAVGGDDCVPEVRLADFGSAFRQYRQISTARDYTAAYSAPEVLAGRSVDEKVDMWALGVVMWVLLTGRHPFGVDLSEKEFARRVAEVEPDLKFLRHVSPEGKDLVRRLLARNPEERPSAQQVLSHPWLRAVVNRSKATTASSQRLIRRRQQQHRQNAQPVEGTWGVMPPRPHDVRAGAGVAEEEGAEAAAAKQRVAGRRPRQDVVVRREDLVEGGEGGATAAAAPGLAEAAAVVASVAGDHLSEMI